ncbi:MAG: hypothetical protein ABJG47_00520 [Ekhidna sp.]
MEQENLHLLITEEIYLLSQDESATSDQRPAVEDAEPTTTPEKETDQETPQIAESESVTSQEAPVETETPTTEPIQPVEKEQEPESPKIPSNEVEEPSEIPFAVFHSSTNASDIELLHKIILACKLPEDQYKIFSGGFDQSVQFKKALVFVPEAKAFYTPIPYKESEFLCSKPLHQISGDVQEKGKLWEALQKFV